MSVRVHQLAKKLGVGSQQVIKLLRERGLNVNSPSNTIPSIYADALMQEIGDKKIILKEEQPVVKTAPSHLETVTHLTSSAPSEVVQESDIASGFETKEVDVSKKLEKFPSPVVSAPHQLRKSITVSIESMNKRQNKQQNEPEVRLPELPKNLPPKDEPLAAPSLPATLKPFLKKIEIQPLKSEELKPLTTKLPIVVRTLASQMDVKPFQLISKLMSMNVFASMNQEIDISIAQSVAEKFGFTLETSKQSTEKPISPDQSAKKIKPEIKRKENLSERPPIVCVLGHVDHGKTTLLDTIRKARVAAGEPGGITQHIAAYQVERNNKKITFIDTPGHAAFSKMRERGANMTDIGILVVAADDGFMPQTDEALKFAKNASIPIVVAINKIDAKGANIDKVKQQMQQRGITSEDWGGETLCAEISALNGTNIDHLLELIQLQAEIMELRADDINPPEGIILEAKLAIGHGPTASAIIENGTLKIGNCIVCGPCYCRVKSLINDRGNSINEAPPSTPVNIVGWSDIPEVGSKFTFVENEKIARKEAEDNALQLKKGNNTPQTSRSAGISNVEQLFSAIAAIEEKVLNVILRVDVHGSSEALIDLLNTIKSKKIKLNILECGVGMITKNDIDLASASNSSIVAFNVKADTATQALAKQLGVKIIQHNIIYELVEQVRLAMVDCLDPELKENKLGAAEVRQIFKIKGDVVAGCMVTEGKILRDKFARVIRKKATIFQGKFSSLRRQKEDAGEVRAGFECGIVLSGFDLFDSEDIIECFEIQKIQPSL